MSLMFENRITRQIAIFTVVFSIAALTPLFLLISAVLLIIRGILTLYKNIFLPDYGDLLSGMNNYFSGDSPYENPLSIVCGHAFISGHFTLEDFQQLLWVKLQEFQKESPQWFPEMRQYVTTLMGFSIMRNERDFQISEHVKLLTDLDDSYRDVVINEENVADISFKLSRIPFIQENSPWEFLLHYNVNVNSKSSSQDEKSMILIFRHHHTLCDALAVMKLLGHFVNTSDIFDSFMTKFKKSVVRPKRNLMQKICNVLSTPTFGLYEAGKLLINSWDDNRWHRGWPNKFWRDFRYIVFEPIPQERIKRIRKLRGDAKFFNVVLTAFTGGLRKYMIKYQVDVPKAIHAVISIPVPKQEYRLSNDLTNILFGLPTGLSSRREILQNLEQQTLASKSSKFPLIALLMTTFLGLFPKKLLPNYWIFTTVATTNFPGFDEMIEILGNKVLNISALATMPAATTGIYFWCSGYMDKLFLTLGLSEHIASSREELMDLRKFIEEELDALEDPSGANDEISHIIQSQRDFSSSSALHVDSVGGRVKMNLRRKADH